MTILRPDRHERRSSGQEGGEVQLAEQVVMEGDECAGEGEAGKQLPPVGTSNTCLICKKPEAHIEFAAWPCGCPSMCRSCAQKLCTGGKCRVCHEMYPEVKRCRLSSTDPGTGSGGSTKC